MEIKVRPITIHDGELFATFMDRIDFSHQPDWKGCYCRFYHTLHNEEVWNKHRGISNRLEAIHEISEGLMHGYLAFLGDKPIGWLNASHWENYPRIEGILKNHADPDSALMICFLIDQGYRRQGVAKTLLAYAEDDLKSLGYKKLFALPASTREITVDSYRGPIKMFEDHGFENIESESGQSLLLKML